jgi:hypothetical protein
VKSVQGTCTAHSAAAVEGQVLVCDEVSARAAVCGGWRRGSARKEAVGRVADIAVRLHSMYDGLRVRSAVRLLAVV